MIWRFAVATPGVAMTQGWELTSCSAARPVPPHEEAGGLVCTGQEIGGGVEELEAAVVEGLATPPRGRHGPPPAAVCANCGAVLQGPFCHACGQDSDTHKRSIGHLLMEMAESLFELDGRLMRTLPDLFLRPGRLARDYLEGRIARHVPPFRTFLVSLLIFIFAAEHATHEITVQNARQDAARTASLVTPQGRAAESLRIRTKAAADLADALKDAADDRADDLKDPDESRQKIAARYAQATADAQGDYARALAKADRVARGLPAPAAEDWGGHTKAGWLRAGIHKASADPDYYLTVLFSWGHRWAILLLPIVGLSLAAVYRNKPRFVIYDHLLVAMDFLSFTFLASAPGMILPTPWGFYWLGRGHPVDPGQPLPDPARGLWIERGRGGAQDLRGVDDHGLRLPHAAAGPAGLQPDAALREGRGFTTEDTEKRRKECAAREALAPPPPSSPGERPGDP